MRNRMSGGVRGRRQKPSPTRSIKPVLHRKLAMVAENTKGYGCEENEKDSFKKH